MAHKTFFKSDMVPLAVERDQRKKAKEVSLQAAYDAVDKRDAGRCWVTGVLTETGATSAKVRRDHHHLRGRNVMPEWREDPDHIITVTRLAHKLITKGWIEVEGDDARQPIRFHWREDVPVKLRTIRIKSRRRSQNRTAA